jgi:heme O synthase-like polyprenyltransferase
LKQLSKFKLSALVALTGSAGFVAGSGEHLDWAGLAWTSIGTMGAACSANALNQLYEISNDARMRRTCNRPLPTGRMLPAHAAGFALVSGAVGLGILYFQASVSDGWFCKSEVPFAGEELSANWSNGKWQMPTADYLLRYECGKCCMAVIIIIKKCTTQTDTHALAQACAHTHTHTHYLLILQTNALTAGLGAANIGLYAGVYTPLKQLTVANT